MCFHMRNKHIGLLLLVFTVFWAICQNAAAESGSDLSEKGMVLTFEEPLPFRIYLPESDDESERFPVLYLLHGQGQDESVWDRLDLFKLADRLITEGVIRPMIIVVPREERYLEEIHESDYGKELLTKLIPFVDDRFSTLNDRASRAIGGISRGALWAQLLSFTSYETFGVLGQHSLPSGFVSPSLVYRQAETYRKTLPEIRIRIDSGEDDPYLKGARTFSAQLTTLNYPHTFVVNPGGHDEAYWKANLESYLIWYSRNLSETRSHS